MIDNGWDDLLHESLTYPSEAMNHTESMDSLHAYELELGSGIWGAHSRRMDPTGVLGSIGAIPSYNPYSSKSSDSSPVLSDDYMYSPNELRRHSGSTVSSEGTISPKDSIFIPSELSEGIGGYFAFHNSPPSYQDTPTPISPISPRPPLRPTPRGSIQMKPDKPEEPPPTASRRRSSKITPASTSTTKSGATSNNNNSKPLTARDRKRRQMHNASAMRSRIRLNETLDKMWKTIPASRRRKRQMSVNEDGAEGGHHEQMDDDLDDDDDERIGRADKVEVGIDYIIYLEERVKELENHLPDSD